VLNWAGTMTWKGLRPVVHLLEATYEKPEFCEFLFNLGSNGNQGPL
jgi:hypothetical protein